MYIWVSMMLDWNISYLSSNREVDSRFLFGCYSRIFLHIAISWYLSLGILSSGNNVLVDRSLFFPLFLGREEGGGVLTLWGIAVVYFLSVSTSLVCVIINTTLKGSLADIRTPWIQKWKETITPSRSCAGSIQLRLWRQSLDFVFSASSNQGGWQHSLSQTQHLHTPPAGLRRTFVSALIHGCADGDAR